MIETPQFKFWVAEQTRQGASAEERVAAEMVDENIRTEVRVEGKWAEVDIEDLTG